MTATGKARLDVVVRSVSSVPAPTPEVVVVQALPKATGASSWSLLTEIGVARIVPWAAARSVAVWRGDRAAKSLAGGSPRAGGRRTVPTSLVPRGDAAGVDRPGRRAHPGAPSPSSCTRTPPAAAGELPDRVLLVVGPRAVEPEELAAFTDAALVPSGSAPRCSARPPPGRRRLRAALAHAPLALTRLELCAGSSAAVVHPGDLVVELGLLLLREVPDCRELDAAVGDPPQAPEPAAEKSEIAMPPLTPSTG